MKELEHLQLISFEEAKKVATVDGSKCSTKGNYAEDNVLGYYLLINTWLLIIREYCQYAWSRMLDKIQADGLLATIADCQRDADVLIHGDGMLSPYARTLLTELTITGRPRSAYLFPELNIGREPKVTLLFILRYPKRFSPNSNDRIQKESLDDFIKVERENKMLQRTQSGHFTHDRGMSDYVIRSMREIISSYYDWDSLCDQIEDIDISDIEFSSGAGFDSRASLGSKLLAIYRSHPEYFPTPFGARIMDVPKTVDEDPVRYARIAAVPKSYKAARIIAMEDTYRLAFCKRVEKIFRRQDEVTHHFALEDQTVNQQYAEEGSRTGDLATLDASHGSDRISWSLFVSVFPSRYVRLITPYIATHEIVDGKVIRKEMLSTSGHTLTFRHETIVYKAIAQAASELYHCFTGGESFAWAYGDDTIIDTDAAPTAIEFFEAVGMKINVDKSFYSRKNLYRESCGQEYRNGVVMTGVYFPRFPIKGTRTKGRITFSKDVYNDEYRGKLDDSTTMLIDLQHKILPVSYPAARLVHLVLRSALPFLTSSLVGTESPDPWDFDDLGITQRPKAYSIVTLSIGRVWTVGGKDYKILCPSLVSRQLFEIEMSDEMRSSVMEQGGNWDKYHFAPYVAYDGKEKYSDLEVAVYDMYRYQRFLKYGPEYNSELDRLLGISQRPIPISQVFGKRRMAWRKILI